MKKLILLIGLVLALAAPASAQSTVKLWSFHDSGDIDANDESVLISNAQGAGTLGLQVTGTFTGTIVVECSIDNSNYQAIRITPTNSTTAATSLTSTGVWTGAVAGCRRIRARSTAWTSGTATVVLLGTTTGGGASSGAAGGGANAAASATGSTVPADASYTGINVGGNLIGVTGVSAGSHRAPAVAIVDSSGNQISSFGGSGGTSVAEDVASANADLGTPAFARRTATPANTSGADGDYESLQMSAGRLWVSAVVDSALPTGANVIGGVTQSGTWNINHVSGTITLPTGASSAANQTTIIGHLDGVETTLTSIEVATEAAQNSLANIETNLSADAIYDNVALTTGPQTMLRFDDASVGTVTEGNSVSWRGSANGVGYIQIRDPSNERGANVTAANELSVELGAGSALAGRVQLDAQTANGADTFNVASAASTNSTNVKASAGNVYGITLINTTATLYYLRLYNTASAPTCSSATGYVTTIPVPASTSGAGVTVSLPVGISFSTGISYCLTGGPTSTDNTNAAVGVYGMVNYK
jgi:hypothetical protein